jgi:hypothetical protein
LRNHECRLVPGSLLPLSNAFIAPQCECPQTTMVGTASTSTANSIAAPTELSSSHSLDECTGTRFPMLRTQNWSPGPVDVIRFGSTRESAHVMNNCSGRWPCSASSARNGRSSGADIRSNSSAPSSTGSRGSGIRSARCSQSVHRPTQRAGGIVLRRPGSPSRARRYQVPDCSRTSTWPPRFS